MGSLRHAREEGLETVLGGGIGHCRPRGKQSTVTVLVNGRLRAIKDSYQADEQGQVYHTSPSMVSYEDVYVRHVAFRALIANELVCFVVD